MPPSIRELFLGTTNPGKIREIKACLKTLPVPIRVDTGKNFPRKVKETGDSFEENAYLKARAYYRYTGKPSLAEDSGLVVPSLDGRPGVHSSRYAGEGASDRERIHKVLVNLKTFQGTDRYAFFESVVTAYIEEADGVEVLITGRGIVEGEIALSPQGEKGFGYDPIFIPRGYRQTFAELGDEIKNVVSHRRRAMEDFCRKIISQEF